ncbi:MAG: glycosyltransferase family 2 protein [Burkholderiaceae bacterium]
MSADAVAIAVVIATYRRPPLLRRCLQALLAQRDMAPEAYEIIVVDDGRSDDTKAVVDELAEGCGSVLPRLRYLRPLRGRGPAAMRNHGWRESSAPLLAFTDDDTIPDPRWLACGARAMTEGGPELAAVGGRVIVPLPPDPTDHALNTQGLERAEFVTANAFVRRSALDAVGGFDERFTRAWREDSDLHFALLERCGRVGRAESAIVVHPVREAPWGLSLWQQGNVYFDALLFRKHPALYRRKIRRRPPWRYLFVVGASLVAMAAALSGHAASAAGLAGACLTACLALARQRLRGTSRSPTHIAEMLVTSLVIPYLAVYWRVRGAWRFRTLFP